MDNFDLLRYTVQQVKDTHNINISHEIAIEILEDYFSEYKDVNHLHQFISNIDRNEF